MNRYISSISSVVTAPFFVLLAVDSCLDFFLLSVFVEIPLFGIRFMSEFKDHTIFYQGSGYPLGKSALGVYMHNWTM